MSHGVNPLNLMQRWKGAGVEVVSAIRDASKRTGVSFDYLMNKASQESSFDPKAKASTSSATGLFQFIESTWLSAVKSYGDQFGLGHLAAKISSDGKVADPAARQQILQLREDPDVAANMVAAMTKDNASYLESSLGGKVGQSELYMAHFLGLGGADKFLRARQQNAMQTGADLFPGAAAANRNVFYDASGRKKTVEEIYQFFAKKMGPTNAGDPVTLVASRTPSRQASPVMTSSSGFGQIEAAMDTMTSADRQLLESMLAGVNNFGINQGSKAAGLGGLLSPYTAMIMARLQSPDEAGFMAVDGDRARNDKTKDGQSADQGGLLSKVS